MFNRNIHKIAINNYHTKPVNEPRFDNPYLLQSSNQVLNHLVNNKHLLDRHRRPAPAPEKKPEQKPKPKPLSDDEISDKEDLARHVMREVYQDVGDRRAMEGYVIDRSMSTPETVAYIGKDKVLFGLRGTSDLIKDGATDAQIFLKGTTDFPYTPNMEARFARDEAIYSSIRAKYPNREIIMGGHSLGNSLGMNILKNHPEDRNIKFFGYNGWIHPDYNTDSRAYHTSSPGDLVSAVTPTDFNLPMSDKEKFVAGGIGVGAAGTIGAREYYRRMGNLSREKIAKLQARRDLVDEAVEKDILMDPDDYQPEMRADLEETFPEFTNIRSVFEGNPEFDNLLDNMPEVYVKIEKVGDLRAFVETISDKSSMTWSDFTEKLSSNNEFLDLVDNPKWENATEDAIEAGLIGRDNYLGNVYVSKGQTGVDELLGHTGDEIASILNPVTHSSQMGEAEVTTSQIMKTPGTVHLHPFEDVIAGESRNFSDLEVLEEAAAASAESLALGTSIAVGGLAVASLATAGYWLWSHGADRFKLKKNLFKTKK